MTRARVSRSQVVAIEQARARGWTAARTVRELGGSEALVRRVWAAMDKIVTGGDAEAVARQEAANYYGRPLRDWQRPDSAVVTGLCPVLFGLDGEPVTA